MIDFDVAIELIRRNGGFKPNKRDTSYYRTYTPEGNRPLQARVSNHGTWLWTWYDKDYDPSYAINFCVVFSKNGEYDSDVSVDMSIKDKEGNVIGQKKSFEVIQYVYDCQLLGINDAALINQQVQSIWQNKGFTDPFANTPKHAKVMILRPNEPIKSIIENKQYIKMNKKLIRLTESDLHKVIKESVNKVLTELDWKTKMNYVMGRQKQGDEAYRQGDENGARKYWDKADDGIYDVRDEFEKKYNGRPFRNMKDDKFRMGDINKNTGDIYTSFNHGKCFNNYTSKNGNAPDVYGYNNDYYLDNFEDKNDVDTFRRMNKDVNNYRNGNSKYVKGKGWQLRH